MSAVTPRKYRHDFCSVNLDSVDNFCEIHLKLRGDTSTADLIVRCHRDSVTYLADLPHTVLDCLDTLQANPVTKIRYNYMDHCYETVIHDGPTVYQTLQTSLDNSTFRSIVLFLRRCVRHADTPRELGEKYTDTPSDKPKPGTTSRLTRLFRAHDISGQLIGTFQGFQPKPLVPLVFRHYQQQNDYYEPSISFVTYIHDTELRKINGYVYTHHLKADHHNDVYVLTSTIREIDVPKSVETIIFRFVQKID